MSRDKTAYVARLPRYAVRDLASVSIQVQRSGEPQPLPAMMLDFSRLGMCLAAADPLETGDAVVIFLTVAGDPTIDWQFPATVRWVKRPADEVPSYGCEFVQPVAWEQLGELLLRGVLSQE